MNNFVFYQPSFKNATFREDNVAFLYKKMENLAMTLFSDINSTEITKIINKVRKKIDNLSCVEECLDAVAKNPSILSMLPKHFMSETMCSHAVEHGLIDLAKIPEKFLKEEHVISCLKRDPSQYKKIPEPFKTEKIICEVAKYDDLILSYLKKIEWTTKVTLAALQNTGAPKYWFTPKVMNRLSYDESVKMVKSNPKWLSLVAKKHRTFSFYNKEIGPELLSKGPIDGYPNATVLSELLYYWLNELDTDIEVLKKVIENAPKQFFSTKAGKYWHMLMM